MGLDGKFDELLNQLILIYCTHAETPREVHARTHSDEAPSPHATLIEFVHRHPCQCPGEVFGFRGLHPGALHQAEQQVLSHCGSRQRAEVGETRRCGLLEQ